MAYLLITFYQLFTGAVGLVFSPLAPLISLVAAIVFWISSFVYKYQLMYVFVTRVESGGVSTFLKARSDCTHHKLTYSVRGILFLIG